MLLSAEYTEGIDTTYSNGYGLDGAFKVGNDSIYAENKMAVFRFEQVEYWWYFFNYSFDEIFKVPLNNAPASKWINKYVCETPLNKPFVVKRVNDTYAKVEIISQLPSGEFVYKYGLNDEPSNSLLAPYNYNRDSLYKPNNLIFFIVDPIKQTKPFAGDIEWDSPLENNNELIGYTIYKVDITTNIDTSQEIDLTKWELEAFTTENHIWNGSPYDNIERNVYWNIVAVYKKNDDTLYSEPLKGWTMFPDWVCQKSSNVSNKTGRNIKITLANNHVLFNNFPGNTCQKLNLYDFLGRTIVSVTNNEKNDYIGLNRRLSTGVYTIEAYGGNNNKKAKAINVK
jgi:hypothetical protein